MPPSRNNEGVGDEAVEILRNLGISHDEAMQMPDSLVRAVEDYATSANLVIRGGEISNVAPSSSQVSPPRLSWEEFMNTRGRTSLYGWPDGIPHSQQPTRPDFQLSEGIKWHLRRYAIDDTRMETGRKKLQRELYPSRRLDNGKFILSSHQSWNAVLNGNSGSVSVGVSVCEDGSDLSFTFYNLDENPICNPRGIPSEIREHEYEDMCEQCQSYEPRDSMSYIDGAGTLCESCIESETTSCIHCDAIRLTEEMVMTDEDDEAVGPLCNSCYHSVYESAPQRGYPHGHMEGSASGKIVKSMRRFGIEIEAFTSLHKDAARLRKTMPESFGIGRDGSINTEGGCGIEFASMPMSGDVAEREIEKAADAWKKSNFQVNKSCGFHIHIDVSDLDRMDLYRATVATRNYFAFCVAFEDVITSFLPKSRRESSHYCLPLRYDYHFKEIKEAETMEKLESIWYRANRPQVANYKQDRKHSSRYHGVNMHTYFSARHVEIRYHSGTTNARKILEWANLHTAIIDKIFKDGYPENLHTDFIKKAALSTDVAEKTDVMFNFLGLEPESEAYFRSRQAHFRSTDFAKAKPIKKSQRDATRKLMNAEREQ